MEKEEGVMKKVCFFILCSLLILTIAGCGTMKGMGKDISTLGGWLIKGSDAIQEQEEPEDRLRDNERYGEGY